MVIKPVAEIYPDGGSHEDDPELHQLLCDIVEGNFDDSFYLRKAEVSFQSKKNDKPKRGADVEPPTKKQKGNKGSSEGVVDEEVGNKNIPTNNVADEKDTAVDLRKEPSEQLDLIVKLYDKFDAMENNVSRYLFGIEDRMVAKVNNSLEVFKTSIEDRVSLLETELRELKSRKPYQPSSNADNVKSLGDQEYTSQFQKKNQRPPLPPQKDDDTDIDFVHHDVVADKVQKTKKKQEKQKKKQEKAVIKKVSVIVNKARDDCNKGVVIPNVVDVEDEEPQPPEAVDSEIVDITDKVREEENKMLSESETEEEKIRDAKLNLYFDNLKSAIEKLDGDVIPPKKKWAPPPPYPAIGESGLTCMRKDLVPSQSIYNPLPLKPDPSRREALSNYLRPYENIPLDKKPPDVPTEVHFYRVLITPRSAWPEPKFGWLGDDHISAFMRLLRLRSCQTPTPFHTDRVAFIDAWSVSLWIQDYKQFHMDPKKFKFSEGWLNLARGLAPEDTPTFKTWFIDVDNLFLIHNVGGNHWVTLDIDLKKEKIDIYDSIMGEASAESDKRMIESCRPFMRMTPCVLNEVIPEDVRKMTYKQFSCRRLRKNIPQNRNPGDCGVYSFKYVECLALGVNFEGLRDENIQQIRESMAADILAEAPDYLTQFMS